MAYTSRKHRNRMAERAMPMDSEEVESESPELAGPATPPEGEREEISAFVPMEFFAGKKPEVGDIEKVEIRSIDPETNEVEFVCVYGGSGGEKSIAEDFDESMPA